MRQICLSLSVACPIRHYKYQLHSTLILLKLTTLGTSMPRIGPSFWPSSCSPQESPRSADQLRRELKKLRLIRCLVGLDHVLDHLAC